MAAYRDENRSPCTRARARPRPRPVLQPRHVSRQVPAVDDEMRAADNRERKWILRNEQERNEINERMHERRQRTLRLLHGHPLALQQVVAYRMGYELIDGKHKRLAIIGFDKKTASSGISSQRGRFSRTGAYYCRPCFKAKSKRALSGDLRGSWVHRRVAGE